MHDRQSSLEKNSFRFRGKPTPNSSSMININGVLYKSTSKKLEKTSLSSSLNPSERILVVRGENFILDSSGTKLKRDSVVNNLKLSRIDIGGLTYRASNGGDYERDNSHQVRSHLTLAKTKSISFLSPNALRKTSLICPIYRRIGKCLAYARGRCQKVHDQRYVIVCPNFVKGLCKNETCLLSHNANLHKMPVCKYFLEGHCQKQRECLYLHKKLTDDAKLCAEFLKGYCPLADKVNASHCSTHFLYFATSVFLLSVICCTTSRKRLIAMRSSRLCAIKRTSEERPQMTGKLPVNKSKTSRKFVTTLKSQQRHQMRTTLIFRSEEHSDFFLLSFHSDQLSLSTLIF